jgi:hypothetical protein
VNGEAASPAAANPIFGLTAKNQMNVAEGILQGLGDAGKP